MSKEDKPKRTTYDRSKAQARKDARDTEAERLHEALLANTTVRFHSKLKKRTTPLRWSNRAHTSVIPLDSKHKDLFDVGYVDLAMHVARSPKHFMLVDRQKSARVLRAANIRSVAP